MSLYKRYRRMKYKLAGYSMNICSVIEQNGGSLAQYFKQTTKQSAALKAKKRRADPSPGNLASELTEMLEDFDTSGVEVVATDQGVKVINATCGCLEPFVEQASKYGFTKTDARKFACANCLPSYRLMALNLGAGFEGGLTPAIEQEDSYGGCFMHFKEPS